MSQKKNLLGVHFRSQLEFGWGRAGANCCFAERGGNTSRRESPEVGFTTRGPPERSKQGALVAGENSRKKGRLEKCQKAREKKTHQVRGLGSAKIFPLHLIGKQKQLMGAPLEN